MATSTSEGTAASGASMVVARVVIGCLHYRNLQFCNMGVTMATAYPSACRPQARREQLLDVTKAIVVERGFHAVSIEGVAREAGISRPIVYGHFDDLPGLLDALVGREGARALGQLADVLPAALAHGDPAERLAAALGGYLEACGPTRRRGGSCSCPTRVRRRVLHEAISRGRAAVVAQLAAALGDGERGLASPDPELAAHLLSALADEAARLLLADPDRYPPERVLALARWFLARMVPPCDHRTGWFAAPGHAAARAPRSGPVLAFLVRRLFFALARSSLTAFFAYGIIRAAAARAVPGPGDRAADSAPTSTARCCTSTSAARACSPAALRSSGCGSTASWVDLYPARRRRRVRHRVRRARRAVVRGAPRARAARRALESVATVSTARRSTSIGSRAAAAVRARRSGWSSCRTSSTPHSYAPPLENPWDFLRSMLVPWIVVGAPLGGGDPAPHAGADRRRDGRGLRAHGARRRASRTRRSCAGTPGPPTYVSVASLFGASAPFMVTNMVLVEYVFTVPGFFRHMKRALGQAPGWPPRRIDIPTLQALALWAAVLIVALGAARRPRDRRR